MQGKHGRAARPAADHGQQSSYAQDPGEGHAVEPILLRENTAIQSVISTLSSLGPIATESTRSLGRQYRRLSEGFGLLSRTSAGSTTTADTRSDGAANAIYVEPNMDDDEDGDGDHDPVGAGHDRDDSAEGIDLTASIAGNPSTCASPDGRNDVLWSCWDILPSSARRDATEMLDLPARRVLLQVYSSGMSIWDLSDPEEAKEVFNLSRSILPSGHLICARIVPELRTHLSDTAPAIESSGPLLAVLTSDSVVSLYSLRTHQVTKSVAIAGQAVSFQVNESFLVVACAEPAALHVLALHDLVETAFSPLKDVAVHPVTGRPVYSLSSSRLLAYTSISALATGTGNGIITATSAQISSNNDRDDSLERESAKTLQQATRPGQKSATHGQPLQVSETARRLGEGMMSGVKAISDYGYSKYMSGGPSPPSVDRYRPQNGPFSRSAPQPSYVHSRSPEQKMTTSRGPRSNSNALPPTHTSSRLPAGTGTAVVVVDLVASLKRSSASNSRSSSIASRSRSPATRSNPGLSYVAHFKPSKLHAVTLLSFNPSGAYLLTSSSEGHSFHVFELRPYSLMGSSPARFTSPTAAAVPRRQEPDYNVWHRYRLNRGFTVASAVSATWSDDSRFVAVTTSRGTAHIFPLNPYGGAPGIDTHLSDKVVNPSTLQPLSVTVNVLARIKAPRPLPEQQPSGTDSTLASSPSDAKSPVRVIQPPSIIFGGSGELLAALRGSAVKKGQSVNMFAFYPHLGNLVLSRLSLFASPKTAPATAPLGNRVASQAVSGLTQMMRSGGSLPATLQSEQLVARENKVAYYPLGKQDGWPDLKLDLSKLSRSKRLTPKISTSAHQAEIETFSHHPAVLPRSIYLSQPFTFHLYPPRTASSPADALHPVMRAFSKGDFRFPSSSRRITVRAEVSHTHRYPYSEANGGKELHSAMHTILDAARKSAASSDGLGASATSSAADPEYEFYGSSNNSDSPAFPNGYGRTSSARSWKNTLAVPLPTPIPIPTIGRGLPMAAHSLTKSMERMRQLGSAGVSAGLRSPRSQHAASPKTSSPRHPQNDLTALSFEDDDAVFADLDPDRGQHRSGGAIREAVEEAEYAPGSPFSLPQNEPDELAYGSSAPPLDTDHGSLESRSGGNATSPETTAASSKDDDAEVTGELERDEWEGWKLDGIDDELGGGDVDAELPLLRSVHAISALVQADRVSAVSAQQAACTVADLAEREGNTARLPSVKPTQLISISPPEDAPTAPLAMSIRAARPVDDHLGVSPAPPSGLSTSTGSASSASLGNKKKKGKNGKKSLSSSPASAR